MLERLLAEIDEVLGSRTSVTAEDLEKLKYTEQVRREFSSVFFFFFTKKVTFLIYF